MLLLIFDNLLRKQLKNSLKNLGHTISNEWPPVIYSIIITLRNAIFREYRFIKILYGPNGQTSPFTLKV